MLFTLATQSKLLELVKNEDARPSSSPSLQFTKENKELIFLLIDINSLNDKVKKLNDALPDGETWHNVRVSILDTILAFLIEKV